MRYEGAVYRPPSEAGSLIVQLTIGCARNTCTFCSMYKDKKFRVRDLDEVIEDFYIAKRYYTFGVRRLFLADGDALVSVVSNGLMSEVENVMLPQINAMVPKVDSLITALTALVSNPALVNSLNNVESISHKLDYTVDELNRIFHDELPLLMSNLQGTTDNMNSITSDLATIDFAQTMAQVDSTIVNLLALSVALRSDQNSVGRLLNDTSFYSNLNGVCINANALIEDVKAHPSRYINISVFGKGK